MNNKININPSSTKWLEKDDRVVADYFCDLGFRSLKQILDMRVFDLMNMQGLNAVRVEEVIICLYKWLNPNTAIDEAMKNNYIYVPGLSESVADEVKKEKDAEAPRFITGTGAVKKEAVTHDRGILRTRKVDDRQSIQIPVWEKYALTVKEAAEYYNIAETKLRDYLLANRDAPFVLKGGARLLVKRKMFEMFLDESNII